MCAGNATRSRLVESERWDLGRRPDVRLGIKMKSRLHLAQTYGYWGKGVWDGQVHTAIFKVDNQQGPTVYSTGNSAQC